MYCPNCQQEFSGKFCPECGTKLIERPVQSGTGINLGDANAISGGVHLADSHNVYNEDHSVHHISNSTSTVNNITQVAAQKSEMELLQERKTLFLNACKRAYEDNVLAPSEKMELDRYRIELGLDMATADRILDDVRRLAMRNVPKNELTGLARIKLNQLTEALKKNEIQSLKQQIDSFEALAGKFDNEELQYKYYLVLSALRHEKCINKYEGSKVDNYWESFWSYCAYLKAGKADLASEILFSLDDRFPDYPKDNIALLAAAGSIIRNDRKAGQEYLATIDGNYSPSLQRFTETLFLLLDRQNAEEMGATEEGCAFYISNFFSPDICNPAKEPQQTGKNDNCFTLKQKWQAMTIEGYKMILEVQEDEDFVSIMNMLIPPAMAQIPLAMALTAAGFTNFGHEEEGEKWADKLMALDPQNEDADVLMAKATIYEEGFGRYEKNIQYAIAFYRAAAVKGNMDALGFVSDLYYQGEDIQQDYNSALAWAKAAYEAKNPFGLFIYGRAYFEGNGLPKDTINGKRLIREAAEMDDTFSVGVVEAQLYMKRHFK